MAQPVEAGVTIFPKTRWALWRMAVLVAALVVTAACRLGPPAVAWGAYDPQEGDLAFQSLPHNPLIDAIEGCSGSPFSHCGIVARSDGGWVVLEAIGPVKETPLFRWIAQGRGGEVAVYRLKEERERIPAMIAEARKMAGRPYDIHYSLGDGAIYCSELIWKAWKRAGGTPLGQLVPLGKLAWKPHEAVIREIEAGGLPLQREMITPVAVTRDPRLAEVMRRGL